MTTKARPKRFVNREETVVHDAIDGLLATYPTSLNRLDSYPHTKVIVRRDWDKSNVALVSGGGAGHEPAHAGFVGKGMLTAAVSGEIFASPTSDAVLSAILAVTGPKGCLVIIKNYTGDRLNFGLAAERAKTEYGLNVRTVIVADDVALGCTPKARGIAGTLFVHKIAGAAAEAGGNLAEVHRLAEITAKCVKSMGASFSTCEQAFAVDSRTIGDGIMEVGLGIHGEPGKAKLKVSSSKEIVDQILKLIFSNLKMPETGTALAVMINNLGSVPPMEMSIVTKNVLEWLLDFGSYSAVYLVGPAPLMTSLNMNGISVSVLPLVDLELHRNLLAAVAPHVAWPHVTKPDTRAQNFIKDPLVTPIERGLSSGTARDYDPKMKALIQGACESLISEERALNALDSKVGDGDTGTQMSLGAKSILAALDVGVLDTGNKTKLCKSLSKILAKNMGGSSGILLSILFAAMAGAFAKKHGTAAAFQAGLAAMMFHGGAAEGDRTMLDALIPASKCVSITDAATAAHHGAESTKALKVAGGGRSMYLSAVDLAGHMDPGAYAAAKVLDVLSAGLSNKA